MIDGRVIWGEPSLNTVAAAYRRMRQDHPNALRLQLLNALADRVRARSLRDVLARRGGTFDLKSHAVTPIVNLARWGGLTADVASATTPTRLRAAAEAGAITEHDASTFSVSPTYFGIARSDDAILLQLTVSNTRTREQKQALYRRIVEVLHESPGVRPEDVFINLVEVLPENWSFGHGIAQYVADKS